MKKLNSNRWLLILLVILISLTPLCPIFWTGYAICTAAHWIKVYLSK